MGNTLHADSQRQSGIALEVGVAFIIEALPEGWGVGGGWGGWSRVACLNFKTSCVGVYKCLSLIVGFAVTVAIWPRRVVSCRDFILRAVATFWAMSLVGIYPGRAPLYGEVPPPCLILYPCIYHFRTKRDPFLIPSIGKWYPFHIPVV